MKSLGLSKNNAHKCLIAIDDDTFIPSMPELLKALRPYDPTQRHYRDALSENALQVKKNAYMTFGGAGVIFSEPLLEAMQLNFDSCKELALTIAEGDILLDKCVHISTNTTLELLNGLHQLEFFGDVSGWYKAGINPLLSLITTIAGTSFQFTKHTLYWIYAAPRAFYEGTVFRQITSSLLMAIRFVWYSAAVFQGLNTTIVEGIFPIAERRTFPCYIGKRTIVNP